MKKPQCKDIVVREFCQVFCVQYMLRGSGRLDKKC